VSSLDARMDASSGLAVMDATMAFLSTL
jgi:hypothetical protein